MSKDKLTTLLGALVGAATAAQPVVDSLAPGGSLHGADYVKLAMAVVFTAWGFFTNKA